MTDYKNLTERKPDVILGKPIIKGTRITVELLMLKLASGYSIEQLLEAYPTIQTIPIRAAFEFAADIIANEELTEAA